MTFDITNAANLLALKNEVTDDPITMGYSPDQTKRLLRSLNAGSKNVGGETTKKDLTVKNLLTALDPTDLNIIGIGERIFVESFLSRPLDENLNKWRTKIITAIGAASTTALALDEMIRNKSRAEVLFGKYTEITKADWIAARE